MSYTLRRPLRNVLLFWMTGSLFVLYTTHLPQITRAESSTTIRNNGNPQNRVDIAILGDGYTSGQMGTYANDAELFIQYLFTIEPFKEYQRYFNVHRVDVVSNQSGADEPDRGIFVDTALDATYGCGGTERCICTNQGKVCDVLSRSLQPNQYDAIIVLVNNTRYGGCASGSCGNGIGIGAAYTPRDQNGVLLPGSSAEIIAHELGHSFGLLADEYCYGSCSIFEPSQPNVTTETRRDFIKWKHWIDASTPLPTSTENECLPQMGIVERYRTVIGSEDGGFALRLTPAGTAQFWSMKNGWDLADSVTGGTFLFQGVWTHIAGVFDGSQLRIYLNGRLDGFKPSTFNPAAGTETLKIGARGDDANYPFRGLIDEVRVTNGVVYTADFTPEKRLSPVTGTVGLWLFNSSNANDTSGFANNGTPLNGAVFSTNTPSGKAANRSLSLNGTAAYVRVPDSNSLDVTGPFTAEAWVWIRPPSGPLGLPGLYQGGNYCPAGVYRPTFLSKMDALNAPFEQINSEQLVKRTYAFVSPIDSSSPAASSLTLSPGQVQAFSVTTPSPFTHSLGVTWRVDGQQQGTGPTFNLNANSLSSGNHTVQVTVIDATPVVRNDPEGRLTTSRTWTVSVSGSGSPTEFSLSLNGVNQYVEVNDSNSLDIEGPLTVEAWIKSNTPTAPQQGILERYMAIPGVINGGFALRLAGGQVHFWTMYNGWDWASLTVSSTTISDTQWHHVAGVFDGSQARIYIDGQMVGSSNPTYTPRAGTATLKIGARGDDAGYPFNGLIDEVRYTSGALYTANFTPQPQLTPAAGTKGLWKFSNQSANDTSGLNNHGQLRNGAGFSTDVPASGPAAFYSLSLNGGNQYAEVNDSNSLDIEGPLTVEAWIKSNTPTAPQQGIVERYMPIPGVINGGFALRLSGGQVHFWTMYNGWDWASLTVSSTTITNTQWHHVAGVFDGSQARIYIDGQMVGSSNPTFTPRAGTATLKIGARGDDAGYPFNGLIDEVRYASGALYTANFTPQPHLTAAAGTKGLWKFDNQTANDTSGLNNHGQLRNGAGFSTVVP